MEFTCQQAKLEFFAFRTIYMGEKIQQHSIQFMFPISFRKRQNIVKTVDFHRSHISRISSLPSLRFGAILFAKAVTWHNTRIANASSPWNRMLYIYLNTNKERERVRAEKMKEKRNHPTCECGIFFCFFRSSRTV